MCSWFDNHCGPDGRWLDTGQGPDDTLTCLFKCYTKWYKITCKISDKLEVGFGCHRAFINWRFRTFSHVFCVFWKLCKFRNFEARNFYNPSNERSWAPLSKKYKFISARIYRKKVTAHRKLQKVRKSQKCLDRNACQIAKKQSFTKNFS